MLVAGIPVSEDEDFQEEEDLGPGGEDFAGLEEERPIALRQGHPGRDEHPQSQHGQSWPAQNPPTSQTQSTPDQG